MATPTGVPLATPPVFTMATPAATPEETQPAIATPEEGEDIVASPAGEDATPDVPVVTAEATPDEGTPPAVATPDVPIVTETASPAATAEATLPYGEPGHQAGTAALAAVVDVFGEDAIATPEN
jgi:hypothetical protein